MRAMAFPLVLLLAGGGSILTSRMAGTSSVRETKAAGPVQQVQRMDGPLQRLARAGRFRRQVRAHWTIAVGGRRWRRNRRPLAAAIPCPDNLLHLGAAMRLYLQDWGERLPPADRWVDALRPYVKRKGAWHCPRDLPGRRVSYAMNRRLGERSLSDEQLWDRVLLFESRIGQANVADEGRSLPYPGRHQGGNYYLFCDGRIEWHKKRPPF